MKSKALTNSTVQLDIPPEALLSPKEINGSLEENTAKDGDNHEPDLLEGVVDEGMTKQEVMEMRRKQIEEGNNRKRQILLQAIEADSRECKT